MKWTWKPLIILMLLSACVKTPAPQATFPVRKTQTATYEGPDHIEVDLLRTTEDGPRLFVQVTYPNGNKGLFMLDTGAAISTMSEKAAEQLGLPLQRNFGSVEGLGGTSRFHRTVLPTMNIGAAQFSDIEFAVGVRGIPEYAYFMPLDGILGNNVWSRFILEIDYQADTLVLHRPNSIDVPGNPSPMFFDGSHVFAPIGLQTRGKNPVSDELIMEVDTGASELLLSGPTGQAFKDSFSEGVEPIFGIGASEYMPTSMFLQTTRRIPVGQIQLGGKKLKQPIEAKWLNFRKSSQTIGPQGMRGLIGHELLKKHTVWFDYAGAQFALVKSTRKRRKINGHQVYLDQDISKYGDDADRNLFRSKLLFALDRREDATAHIETYLESQPDDAEARVLLAKVKRATGDLEGAWDALKPVSPGELVDENEIIAAVNGLNLEGRFDEALDLARTAVAARSDKSTAQIALADALLASGFPLAANQALLKAAMFEQNPDANLLRRARVAMAVGDRHGALAKIRRLIQLYPTEGTFIWFYSTLLHDTWDRGTFELDMQHAISRLHPGLRPFDFMVAAHQALGNVKEATHYMKLGIERDCSSDLDRPLRDNCLAWYNSLAKRQQSESLERIERALAAKGDRSDFLDTRAMVHLSRGELDKAQAAALAAARLNPDDIYMLWQAERIASMNKAAQETTP